MTTVSNLAQKTSVVVLGCIVCLALTVGACAQPAPETAGTNVSTPNVASAPGDVQGEVAQKEQPEEASGSVLRVAHFADAVGLDPHIATAMTSQHIFEQVYDTVVRFNEELTIEPGLAERWEVSPDGKTYTFFLRKGVKWHNGREFVADDVKYSIERILSLGGPWSARFALVKDIVVENPHTIRFELAERFVPFLTTLAEPKASIVPHEEVEKHGDLQNVMVGTGPFKLVDYEPGNLYRLEKNPDYWEPGLPKVDELVIKIMPDEATRIAALRTGEVDIIPVNDPLSVEVLEGNPDIKILQVPLLRRHVLVLQTQEPPLGDERVRQALMLGLDRQEIIDIALDGQGKVSGPFPPGLGDWYIPAEELPFYERDVERARELLKEAGYPEGFTVQMYVSPEYGVHIPIAEVLQQQWADIGVKIDIQVVEWGVLLDHWKKGTFQILNMPYAGRTDPYYYTYERFYSESPGNASRFVSDKMDELVTAGTSTQDPEERKAIYDELQHYIVEQAPMIYLSTSTEVFALRDYVSGYKGMPTGWRTYYRETAVKK